MNKSRKQLIFTENMSIEDKQEYKQLFQIFAQFDTNGNGTISVEEWKQAMKRFGHQATDDEVTQMLQQFGIQQRREFNFYQFIGIINKKRMEVMGHQNTQLSKAFRLFDKNLDGNLNAVELKNGLQRMGQTMRLQDLELLVSMADKNQKGSINFQQFSRIMTLK